MRLITGGLTTILATLALASATFASASTNTNTLTGTVGPGFTITMNKKTVNAGKYVITIHDLASIHDFHLTGARRRQEDEHHRHRYDEVDREVEEGDIPLHVRSAPHDHARRSHDHLTLHNKARVAVSIYAGNVRSSKTVRKSGRQDAESASCRPYARRPVITRPSSLLRG
jgi:ABC-type Zn2+ transport system substrate-binding protein/surface adhesin